ncbi:hypothetical protein [Actinoplanes sp. NPDC049802]|uniref:hypothetical protein n=1 Tax=Actinoplanes sp. NPDC049802 TaxID=3154742 RepID=UPI0034040F72
MTRKRPAVSGERRRAHDQPNKIGYRASPPANGHARRWRRCHPLGGEQAAWALAHVRRPVPGPERDDAVREQVLALAGAYEMRP